MSAVLEMPISYTTIGEDEFDDIEGGITVGAVVGIIGAAIAVGGAYYAIGQRAGERSYYAGLRNPKYQEIKWGVRAGAIALAGPVGGPIIMTGFENKFYSMI
jgi:hypothetical protein